MDIGIVEELEDTKSKTKELYISIKENIKDFGIRTIEKNGVKYYFVYIKDSENNNYVLAESDDYDIIKHVLVRLSELNQISKVIYVKYKKNNIVESNYINFIANLFSI